MKSNKIKRPFFIFLLGILVLLTDGCNKDSSGIAVVSTKTVTNISSTKASSGGDITSDGGASVSERGVCWSTGTEPTIADSKTTDASGSGPYSSQLFGLTPNTNYYVRAYATNSVGTAYGASETFTTLNSTIIIGTQEWMAENLNVTNYRNGDPIPNVTDGLQWGSLTTGAYANYDNLISNGDIYGHLYNWYAIMDSRNICPIGWHIPSDAEWTTLVDYLGGTNIAGGKLKATGTTYWLSPNSGATNETGFTALPGGHHDIDATFAEIHTAGGFWSSAEISSSQAWLRAVINNTSEIFQIYSSKNNGVSVRCIKD